MAVTASLSPVPRSSGARHPRLPHHEESRSDSGRRPRVRRDSSRGHPFARRRSRAAVVLRHRPTGHGRYGWGHGPATGDRRWKESQRKENRPRPRSGSRAVEGASGDDRLSRRGTIMGPTGLTAVFGMGTGGTPPVWSPERRPAGGQAGPGTRSGGSVTRASTARRGRHDVGFVHEHGPPNHAGCRLPGFGSGPRPRGRSRGGADRGGQALGC